MNPMSLITLAITFMQLNMGQTAEGKKIINRWLQTTIGDNYTAKDRSGKLETFEEPNLTHVINKLGFTLGE